MTSVFIEDDLLLIYLAAKIGDDNRIAEMKRLVMVKRDHICHAHNEYVLAIREYNFNDDLYIRKMHNLLTYQEDSQLILNRQWLVHKILLLYTNTYTYNIQL